jgi:hypothetical protein
MKPDFETAALKATEILIQNKISAAPVIPMPILKNYPGVLLLSFTEMSMNLGMDRNNLLQLVGDENMDSVTYVQRDGDHLQYIVAYNQRLPLYMLQRSLARELGHIVLGHDGSRPEDVRNAEAQAFAIHLISPRPLLHAFRQSGLPLTIESIGCMTGCYDSCLAKMRSTPGVHIPAELNRKVRDQFSDYVATYVRFLQSHPFPNDLYLTLANYGSYMDFYEE